MRILIKNQLNGPFCRVLAHWWPTGGSEMSCRTKSPLCLVSRSLRIDQQVTTPLHIYDSLLLVHEKSN